MHTYFMERALEIATRGKGKTRPNPCVGAVITKGEEILGEGWHRTYGGPHAEIEAISDAKSKGHILKEATLWVTLEPCNHHGKTPPCSHAILREGIRRVIIGCLDPNPSVKGGGAQFLRDNGVEVITGVREEEAKELIRDFKVWALEHRPYIIVKLAQTLDGKIATKEGESKWISCASSRDMVHKIRSDSDAIVVGGRTFFKDNPRLTVRTGDNSPKKQPLAIVVCTTPPPREKEFFLLQERATETIFWTCEDLISKWEKWIDRGLEVWGLPLKEEKQIDLKEALCRLFKERGCYLVLCEGGGILAGSFLKQSLIDELQLFVAPKVLGDEKAKNSFAGFNISHMEEAMQWELKEFKKIGRDLWMRLFPIY